MLVACVSMVVDRALLVSDYKRHTVTVVRDGERILVWGQDGVNGNTDWPNETTLFDGPGCMACEGVMTIVVCGGSDYGTRLARCGETTCMRQYLYNLNLIYLFIGYTGRTRRSRIKSSVPPVKNLEDGLQRFGWPACRFFQDLVVIEKIQWRIQVAICEGSTVLLTQSLSMACIVLCRVHRHW